MININHLNQLNHHIYQQHNQYRLIDPSFELLRLSLQRLPNYLQ
nr:MAG TPA: hypothetical protein [Caudoviricetes sp.]